MELSPKTQRLSRMFVITGIVTLLLSYLYFLIVSYLDDDYCGWRSAPSHELCKIVNGIGDLFIIPFAILIGLCILSVLGWAALRSDRRGKVFILILLVLSVIQLGIFTLYYHRPTTIPVGLILYALIILLVATAVYNAWKDKMRKIRGFFFLVVFLLLVVFSAPIPAECQKSLPFGGGDGFDAVGYGYEPCHSIFTQRYWEHQNKENWGVFIFRTTLFREFYDDRPGTVILYD